MKKEIAKTITLIMLICVSVVLFFQIWTFEELWPNGYNSFLNAKDNTVLQRFIGFLSPNTNSISRTSTPITDVITPKQFILTSSSKREIITLRSQKYTATYDKVKSLSTYFSSIKTKATPISKNEFLSVLRRESIVVDYGINIDGIMLKWIFNATDDLSGSVPSIQRIAIATGGTLLQDLNIYFQGDNQYFRVSLQGVKSFDDFIRKTISQDAQDLSYSFEWAHDVLETDIQRQRPAYISSFVLLNVNEIQSRPATTYILPEMSNTEKISHESENVLKLFGFRINNPKKYIDTENKYVYVENNGQIKISPNNGTYEYESITQNNGISLFSSNTPDSEQFEKTLSNTYGIVSYVLKTFDLRGIDLRIENDIIKNDNGMYTIDFGYYLNGKPLLFKDANGNMTHGAQVTINNGILIKYKQYIRDVSFGQQQLVQTSIFKAIDVISEKHLTNQTAIMLDDVYLAYIDSLGIEKQATWCVKRNDNNKILPAE